jgi:hypothetical protein
MYGETIETGAETPAKKRRFLEILVETGGNVTAACKSIKIGRATAYRWREDDEDFARHWDIAHDLSTQALEDECIRRATIGTPRPVFFQGKIVGSIREKSDILLIFMLKARKPEVYRDKFEGRGPSGTQMRAAATFGLVPAPTLIDTLGDAARAADKLLSYSMSVEVAPLPADAAAAPAAASPPSPGAAAPPAEPPPDAGQAAAPAAPPLLDV